MTKEKRNNLNETNEYSLSGLYQAISYFGTQTALAKKLGFDKSTVTSWIKRRRKITAETAISIEKATNGTVSREDVRPDLFIK
ncbi:transcriptional regulator [Neisseria sp. Ec49-e6-T10]|uniref:transcriptional regulator n=1 Tax=Neisseria sp. Ec49-e6-T10 TaxID=3140744 RepID=UPI003EB8139D